MTVPILRVFVFTQKATVSWLRLATRVSGFSTRAKSAALFPRNTSFRCEENDDDGEAEAELEAGCGFNDDGDDGDDDDVEG